MKEARMQREKRCPVCKREYSEGDNYCEYDGSALEPAQATSDKPSSVLAATPLQGTK